MFFNLFKSPSFLSLSFCPVLKTLPKEEYSNFAFLIKCALYPKFSPAEYSYFSNSPLDNADVLAASLYNLY